MDYSQIQIKAAKENAQLHGYDRIPVSDKGAEKFLDWYLNDKNYNRINEQREYWKQTFSDQSSWELPTE